MTIAAGKTAPRTTMRGVLRRVVPGWRHREVAWLGGLALVAVLAFSIAPLSRLSLAAFEPGLAAFVASITTPDVAQATANTLLVAAGSATIAIVCGTLLALILAVTDVRGRQAIAFLFVLSLMVAPQVAALAFKMLAGPASPLLKAIGLAPQPGTPNPMLGADGIILVMGLQHAPLVAITVAAGLASLPRSIIEAALIDGARPLQIVTRIVLPLVRPWLVSASILVLVAGVGNFGIPALLGLPVGFNTLPTLVYRRLASFGPQVIGDAAAVSVLIALIAGVGVIAASLIMTRRPARLEAGHAMTVFWRLGCWRRSVELAIWLFMAIAVLIPALSLIATSIQPAYGVRLTPATATLANFAEVLWRQDLTVAAFRNSLVYAGGAALALGVLSLAIAHWLDRRAGRLRGVFAALLEMPYALPGIVLAIACILLFLPPLPVLGISIYATPWIIMFAYAARFLPIVLKPVMAAVSVMDEEIEEAAICDGARPGQRLVRIVLPMVFPAVVAGMLMAFLLAFNELTVSALLWTAGTQTLGVALLSLEDAGLATQSAAVAVTATLVVAAIMGLLDSLRGKLPEDALPWRQLAGRTG